MLPGVANVCGAVHVVLAPAPPKLPPSADHAKVSCDVGVSASVTVAEMATVSSTSANCDGSRGFDPFTTIEAITGGALATYVNPPGSETVWPLTVTTTSALPVAWTGAAAVIVWASTTATCVAAAPPIATVAPAAKFAPLIVTAVPPAVDPAPGMMLVTRRSAGDGPAVGPPHAGTRSDNAHSS